ncbi:MAG: phage tail tape measure C-terminal domain-containing protein [Rubrivivax sp.]
MTTALNVGELLIGLRADVKRLQSDMDDAKRSVQTAMGDIDKYVGLAKTAFLTLGGVLTVNAFKNAIEGAIDYKAKLYDLSTQTGISVEALGALAKTGKSTGTGLDEITAASARLSKAVQTQNEDSKGAAQAIKAIGLNFTEFKALRPEEQMLAVAKALAGFQDGAGKTAAAMELFGKTGASLLPFLRDLSERTDLHSKQTAEAARQAKEYQEGLLKLKSAGGEWRDQLATAMLPTLNEFISLTVKATREGGLLQGVLVGIGGGVAKLAGLDEIGRLQGRAKDLSGEIERVTNIMVGLSNVLERDPGNENAARRYENLRQKLSGLQREAGEASTKLKILADEEAFGNRMPTISGNAGKPQISGLAAESEEAKKAQSAYESLMKSIRDKVAVDKAQADSVTQLTEGQKLQAKIFADIDEGTVKYTLAQKLAIDAAVQELLEIEKKNEALKLEAKYLQEAGAENVKYIESQQKRRDALEGDRDASRRDLAEYGLTEAELRKLANARLLDAAASLEQKAAALDPEFQREQVELYRQQAQALRDTAAAREQLDRKIASGRNDPLAGLQRGVKNYLSDIERAGDATESAVRNAMQSLEDSGVEALKTGNVKQLAKAWVDQILSEVYRLYVVRPLLQSIFGSGSGEGGGWLDALVSLAGSFSSGSGVVAGDSPYSATSADIRGRRADGGPVAAGSTYLVGERGPELLRLGSQGGAVIPNGAFGGSNVKVVVNNNAAGTKATTRERDTDEGKLIEVLIEAAASNVRSGGVLADAFAGTYGLNRGGSAPRY